MFRRNSHWIVWLFVFWHCSLAWRCLFHFTEKWTYIICAVWLFSLFVCTVSLLLLVVVFDGQSLFQHPVYSDQHPLDNVRHKVLHLEFLTHCNIFHFILLSLTLYAIVGVRQTLLNEIFWLSDSRQFKSNFMSTIFLVRCCVFVCLCFSLSLLLFLCCCKCFSFSLSCLTMFRLDCSLYVSFIYFCAYSYKCSPHSAMSHKLKSKNGTVVQWTWTLSISVVCVLGDQWSPSTDHLVERCIFCKTIADTCTRWVNRCLEGIYSGHWWHSTEAPQRRREKES